MHKANGFTRQEILTAIKMHGPLTADELSGILGISPVAVRQHLTMLQSDGHIATHIERRSMGRPAHRFVLTREGDESFPRKYDVLLIQLLDELRMMSGQDAVSALFEARRKRLMESMQTRLAGKSLRERVKEITKIHSEMGFMANLQETNGNFLLSVHNCIFCNIAHSYPMVCEHQMQIYKDIIGEQAKVIRTMHILDGDSYCSFRIEPAETVSMNKSENPERMLVTA